MENRTSLNTLLHTIINEVYKKYISLQIFCLFVYSFLIAKAAGGADQ